MIVVIFFQRESHLFRECEEKLEDFVLTITLPLYFAVSGLKTDVTQINTATAGGLLILVCAAATAGKIIGCGSTAYLSGLKKRESIVVGVLMNTRGLVELIVLNLGLTSGVLNIPVFSIMVIMALFTTFLTCPIIEIIYPLKRRKYLEEVIQKKVEEQVDDVESGLDNIMPISSLMDFSPEALTKEVKICLVLDKTEHIPGLLDILYLFAPMSPTAQLSVTGLHFIEPTNTEKDKFLAVNTNGRVISVEKKTPDMDLAILDRDDGSARIELREYLELLPLSMFCSAIDASIDLFRVLGDPDEFPRELRYKADQFGCDLVLMPWRNAHYLQRFFWNFLQRTNGPIALIAQLGESTSSAALIIGGNNLETIKEDDEEEEEDLAQQLRSGKDRATSISAFVTRKSIKSILVVISGASTDPLSLVIIRRIAERKTVTVTIAIFGDVSSFPITVREALDILAENSSKFANIDVKRVETAFAFPLAEQVAKECSRKTYDLIITGFVEPALVTPSGIQSDDEYSSGSPGELGARSRARSSSFSVIVKTISLKSLPSKQEVQSYKRSLGMSEALVNSDLKHTELGVIGDRISRMPRQASTFLIVLHPPKDIPDRKRTMSDGGGTSGGSIVGSNGANTSESNNDNNLRDRTPTASSDIVQSIEANVRETHAV